jgi:chromosome partitioning protein
MKIIATASTKGGVGKSTLAACLGAQAAREGHRVYLVDLDPQQSTAAWWRRAGCPDNPMLVTGVDTVSRAAELIKQKGAERDYFIIDTPGSMMPVIADAVMMADAIAVIVQPSAKDIEAQGAVEGLMIKLARTDRSLYVINRCDRRSSLPFEAFASVSTKSIYPPFMIGERVAYVRSDNKGGTGPDMDNEAAEEIAALWLTLKEISHAKKDERGLRPLHGTAGHARGSAAAGSGGPGPARRQNRAANGANNPGHDENHAGKKEAASRSDA